MAHGHSWFNPIHGWVLLINIGKRIANHPQRVRVVYIYFAAIQSHPIEMDTIKIVKSSW